MRSSQDVGRRTGELNVQKLHAEFKKLERGPGGRRGKLKIPSFRLLLERLGFTKDAALANRLFKAFDTGNNGVVSLDELQGGLALLCGGSGLQKTALLFSLMDGDGDGSVDEPELRRFVAGFFVLTQDTMHGVLDSIEGMLPFPEEDSLFGDRGLAGQNANKQRRSDLYERLETTVQSVLKRRQAEVVERILIIGCVTLTCPHSTFLRRP
jgi:Ca2+-binding EF-hand superfamily protein